MLAEAWTPQLSPRVHNYVAPKGSQRPSWMVFRHSSFWILTDSYRCSVMYPEAVDILSKVDIAGARDSKRGEAVIPDRLINDDAPDWHQMTVVSFHTDVPLLLG